MDVLERPVREYEITLDELVGVLSGLGDLPKTAVVVGAQITGYNRLVLSLECCDFAGQPISLPPPRIPLRLEPLVRKLTELADVPIEAEAA